MGTLSRGFDAEALAADGVWRPSNQLCAAPRRRRTDFRPGVRSVFAEPRHAGATARVRMVRGSRLHRVLAAQQRPVPDALPRRHQSAGGRSPADVPSRKITWRSGSAFINPTIWRTFRRQSNGTLSSAIRRTSSTISTRRGRCAPMTTDCRKQLLLHRHHAARRHAAGLGGGAVGLGRPWTSFRGAPKARARNPGHRNFLLFWIPGSPLRGAPE